MGIIKEKEQTVAKQKKKEDKQETTQAGSALSRSFSVAQFLEERDVVALAQAEYARQTNQAVTAVGNSLHIAIIHDQQLIEQHPDGLVEINDKEITEGINQAASGRPAFFAISNQSHWAIIALLPHGSNGEIRVMYMNSAYGRGAEGYYACKLVGLDSCQAIVTAINETRLNNNQARLPIVAEHILLEPTQQIENNCGAVAGFNIAGIAAWYEGGKREPLITFLGGLEYNRILAKQDKGTFETYVRSRFAEVGSRGIVRTEPLSEILFPHVILQEVNITRAQYSLILNQVDNDRAKFEDNSSLQGINIKQQQALWEYYSNRKAEIEKMRQDKGTKKDEISKKEYSFSSIGDVQLLLEEVERDLETAEGPKRENLLKKQMIIKKFLKIVDEHKTRSNGAERAASVTTESEQFLGKNDQFNAQSFEQLAEYLRKIDRESATPVEPNANLNQDAEILLTTLKYLSSLKDLKDINKEELFSHLINLSKVSHNDTSKLLIRKKYDYICRAPNQQSDNSENNQSRKEGIPFVMLTYLDKVPDVSKETVFSDIKLDIANLTEKLFYILNTERALLTAIQVEELDKLCLKTPKNLGGELTKLRKAIQPHMEKSILELVQEEVQLCQKLKLDLTKRNDRYVFARIFTKIGEVLHELKIYCEKKEKFYEFYNAFDNLRNKIIHHAYNDAIVHGLKEPKKTNETINNIIESTIKLLTGPSEPKLLENIKASCDELEKLLSSSIKDTKKHKVNNAPVVTPNVQPKAKKELSVGELIGKANQYLEAGKENSDRAKSKQEKFNLEYVELRKNKKFDNCDYPKDLVSCTNEQIVDFAAKNRNQEPRKTSLSGSTSSLGSQEQDKSGKLKILFTKVDREMAYYLEIEKSEFDLKKRLYASQHSMTIIGQCLKEIMESYTDDKLKKYASKTYSDLQSRGKDLRNKGLAHNIFTFSAENFWQTVQFDIVPAHSDLQAVHYIIANDNNNSKPSIATIIFNNIGYSYHRLGFYDNAIEKYILSMQRLPSDLQEIMRATIRASGIKVADDDLIEDGDKKLFGVNIYELQIANNLLDSYLAKGDYKNASVLVDGIFLMTDSAALETSGKDELLDGLGRLINGITHYLSDTGKFDEVIKRSEKTLKWSKNANTTQAMAVTLANTLVSANKISEAEKLIEEGLKSKNILIQIGAYISESNLLATKKNCAGAQQSIQKAEKLINNNIPALKKQLGDRLALLQIDLIAESIYASSTQRTIEDIHRFEKNFQSISVTLPKQFHTSREVGRYYAFMSNAYSGLIAKNGQDRKSSLQIAKDYLNKAIKILPSDSTHLKRSVEEFTTNYHNFANESLPTQELVFALEEIRKLQNDYKLDDFMTKCKLGSAYLDLADEFSVQNDLNSAQKNYLQAVSYAEKAFKDYQTRPGNTNNYDKHLYIKSLITCSMAYESLFVCTQEVTYLNKALEKIDKSLNTMDKDAQDLASAQKLKKDYSDKLHKLGGPKEQKSHLINQIKFDETGKKVLTQFSKLKLSPNCSNAELSVANIREQDIREFCKAKLNIAASDIIFEDNTADISLNREAIKLLRNMEQSKAPLSRR
jgi:uncharacterized protein with HEPN domain